MKIINPTDVQIGQWFTTCCHRDLRQITTQSDLDEVLEIMTDGDGETVNVWEGRIEALNDIKGWMMNSGELNDVVEIDHLLSEPVPNSLAPGIGIKEGQK